MKAGDLSHLLTLHAPAGTVGVEASDIETGVPAAIEVLPLPFQARETIVAGGPQTSTLYTVTMRYREDLNASMVLVEECHTQRRFQIVAVIPGDKRDAVQMTCVTQG